MLTEQKSHFSEKEMGEAASLQALMPNPPKKRKILVVDDDVEMAEVLRHSLSRCYGIDVAIATDAYQAISLMLEESFDFVLLDWNLPNMNGFNAICEAEKIFLQATHTLQFRSKKMRVATFSAGLRETCKLPSTRHFTYVGHISKQSRLQTIVQAVHEYFTGMTAFAH